MVPSEYIKQLEKQLPEEVAEETVIIGGTIIRPHNITDFDVYVRNKELEMQYDLEEIFDSIDWPYFHQLDFVTSLSTDDHVNKEGLCLTDYIVNNEHYIEKAGESIWQLNIKGLFITKIASIINRDLKKKQDAEDIKAICNILGINKIPMTVSELIGSLPRDIRVVFKLFPDLKDNVECFIEAYHES